MEYQTLITRRAGILLHIVDHHEYSVGTFNTGNSVELPTHHLFTFITSMLLQKKSQHDLSYLSSFLLSSPLLSLINNHSKHCQSLLSSLNSVSRCVLHQSTFFLLTLYSLLYNGVRHWKTLGGTGVSQERYERMLPHPIFLRNRLTYDWLRA